MKDAVQDVGGADCVVDDQHSIVLGVVGNQLLHLLICAERFKDLLVQDTKTTRFDGAQDKDVIGVFTAL